MANRFFDALARGRGETWEPKVGPRLPTWFASAGIEPLEVQLFPVSVSRLGPPEPAVWSARRVAIEAAIASSSDPAVRSIGAEYLRALEEYRIAAAAAGAGFVEIHSTLLFGVVGQREQSIAGVRRDG